MPEAGIQTDYAAQFGRGLWRYVRGRFAMAGQDSFTDPPGQNEDMFEQLLNVMPPVQGDLDRRYGYKAWNTAVTHGASTINKPYPMGFWNGDPAVTRNIVSADSTSLMAFLEDGTTPTTIAAYAGTPRTINSRGWLYIADSFVNQAWNGITENILRKWGIDINPVIGPNVAGNGANRGGTHVPWTNPNNVTSPVAYATVSLTGSSNLSQQIAATTFGFAVAAGAIISGIVVTMDVIVSDPTFKAGFNLLMQKAGAPVGLSKFPVSTTTSATTITFGSSVDLWGTSWLPADINAANFGVIIGAQTNTATGTTNFSLRNVRLTIYTKASPITIGAFAGTGVTLVSGRTYFTTYYNSLVGDFSDLSLPSASTGPVNNQSIPLSTIPVSSDPQVDRKKVLATADGGDQTTLYELTDLPNATTTFTDNIPEATLLLNNQWQATLIDGSDVGVADNLPPPTGLQFPTTHRGRVYGLVSSNLYYSKALSDLITPTNAVAGRFEECWPGLNFFPISGTAEQGRGLLSDGTVLYIGTDRRIIRLFGDGPNTFLQPQVLFDNVGILNQDVWKMVLIEGNPIGAMWLTPDYRVLGSDFNTYQDVGTPVQNVLNSINVAAIQTAWAVNYNQSIFNLYVLAVPTGSNTQPDTLLIFDIKGRKWYTWQLTDTAVGGFWWVTLGGIPQFVFQASTGKYYVFDPTLLQDRVGDTPVNFTATARTSWLSLGDGTAYKQLNEIEVGTNDLTGTFTLTVEGASAISDYFTPRAVVTNAPLVQKPRGTYGVFLAGASTRDRHYRFTFNFADNQTDLLRSFNIQGIVINRI